jgi:citrate lyase beta subunit
VADGARLYPVVPAGGRFARTNPVHPGLDAEIEALLAAGADVLMLPYFHRMEEVERFAALVAGRALTVGLAETPAALGLVERIAGDRLLDELHFGLTDLGIALDRTMPEVMRDPYFLAAVAAVRGTGMPFGIAGLARPGDATLPHDPGAFARDVAARGATRALVSRSFMRNRGLDQLAGDVAALRAFLATAT